MKGEFLLNILETIEKTIYSLGDFVEDFAASSKSNYYNLRYPLMRNHKTLAESIRKNIQNKESEKKNRELVLKEKQRLYAMIYNLQKQGLIHKKQASGKIFLEITEMGKLKRAKLQRQIESRIPRREYQTEKTNELIIVSFDIPEIEKSKREWLRFVLKNLGLRMLQKSVWMGKIKIPKELVDDLRKYNLLKFVEIFSVGKTGTIRHVV